MNTKTKSIIGVTIAVLVLGGIWWYTTNNKYVSKDKEPIKIGFISPLTGDPAVIGIQQMNAVKIAVDEINASNALNGRQIEVIYEDSKCESKEAVSAANKLINIDKVNIILGDVCSAGTMGIKNLTEENKIIVFTWGSSPEITKGSNYIFRNSPSDDAAGQDLASIIFEKGFKKIAILTLNADFTNAFFTPFEKKFQELGGEVIEKEVGLPDAKDFRSSILKIKQSAPEAIITLGTDPKNTGLMVKQLREQGLLQQIFSAYAFSSPAATEAAGKNNAKGIIFLDAPKLDTNITTAKNFLEKYQTLFNESPKGNEFAAGAAYDSVYILKNALLKCNEKNSDCIKSSLSGMNFSGVLGNYVIGADGDVSGIQYSINTVE